jgi:hypothetical protein
MSDEIFTVGKLIEALKKVNPDTPVYAAGLQARPIKRITFTTFGDPSKGRPAGEPDAPSVVVLE